MQYWQCALWMVFGSSLVVTQAVQAQAPDLVVVRGNVLTLNQNSPRAEAVAVREGKIVAVGTTAEIQKSVGKTTRIVDAQGKLVIPGLIETHVHASGAARGEAQQPFVQLGSIGEIQDWLRKHAGETPAGEWVRLPRVDVTRIRERRMPTREELDAACPDRPALFHWQYANRQVQILNSLALQEAGITGQTEAPRGGKIHLDSSGQPTGVLENCGTLTAKFLPRHDVPEDVYLESLERLLRLYNARGITSIFERNTNLEGFRTYEKLRDQGRLPVRVTTTIGLGTDGSVAGTEKAIRALPFKTGDGDEWVKVGPLKIGVDGGVLYGTAFLRDPYGPSAFALYGIDDPQYRGDLRVPRENLKNIIRTGHRLGWQMSSHVTGDAGVDAVLDAVEAANEDAPIFDRRYTLIHAYFPNPETARRAARLGVCVDTQPAWYYKDGDALADALGAHRLEQFIGLQVWRNGGVRVAINSDHMQGFGPQSSLNPYDPFLTMYVAVSRKTESGLVLGADQRVSREEALRMMTSEAAYLSFDEANRGTIEVGKWGDLAILQDDLLTCDEERIKESRSLVTIVGGKVVYESRSDSRKSF